MDKAASLALEDVGPVVALTVSPQLSAEVAERQTLYETPLGPPSVGIIWRPTTPIVLIDTTAQGRTGSPSGTTTTGASSSARSSARSTRRTSFQRHLPLGAVAAAQLRGVGRLVAIGDNGSRSAAASSPA